jgi:transcriptional regulator with XRE-family HTH domain
MTNLSDTPETFGQYFKRLRKSKKPKISQDEVATHAGVTQQYISVIEKSAGTPEEPEVDPETAVKMAEYVGGTRREALRSLGRDPDSHRFNPPLPTDILTLKSGVIVELYSSGGKKIRLTPEILKRLETEAEIQQERGEFE